MKTILLLFATIFFSISLVASNEPVDLKIEIDKAIEVKSGKDSSQIQMWVSIVCAFITLSGTAFVALISRKTAMRTLEIQSKKSFDYQNRQHSLNLLRESIIGYLTIISKTMLIPRLEKGTPTIPDENFTGVIAAQTNLILMLDPKKKENVELINELNLLSKYAISLKQEEVFKSPEQYAKVQSLLRNLLKSKWDKIKGL